MQNTRREISRRVFCDLIAEGSLSVIASAHLFQIKGQKIGLQAGIKFPHFLPRQKDDIAAPVVIDREDTFMPERHKTDVGTVGGIIN